MGDRSIAQLAAVIAESMPQDTDVKCSLEDAAKVAQYIYSEFYSPEARERNKPATDTRTPTTTNERRDRDQRGSKQDS